MSLARRHGGVESRVTGGEHIILSHRLWIGNVVILR